MTIHSAPAAAKIESNSRAKAETSEEPQRPNERNIPYLSRAFQTSAIWPKQRREASNQSLIHVPGSHSESFLQDPLLLAAGEQMEFSENRLALAVGIELLDEPIDVA